MLKLIDHTSVDFNNVSHPRLPVGITCCEFLLRVFLFNDTIFMPWIKDVLEIQNISNCVRIRKQDSPV